MLFHFTIRRMYYSIKVYCENDYYGPDCTTRCTPQNNNDGHYSCQFDTGAHICSDGTVINAVVFRNLIFYSYSHKYTWKHGTFRMDRSARLQHATCVYIGRHVPQRRALCARPGGASLWVSARLPRRALRDALRPVRRGGRAVLRCARHLLSLSRSAGPRVPVRLWAVLDRADLQYIRSERLPMRHRRGKRGQFVSERRHLLHRSAHRNPSLPLPLAVRGLPLPVQWESARRLVLKCPYRSESAWRQLY